MKLHVETTNGFLNDKYSKHADDSLKFQGNPILSFPITISEAPENTVSFAITFIDHDAVPVCGFSWIHWLCCNIDSSLNVIPEGIGDIDKYQCVHGRNSFCSKLIGEEDERISHRYIGPMPPDKDHKYELKIYALDTKLPLNYGYYYNMFLNEIEGHVLEESTIYLSCRV